jgi:chemotaxis-related protein WspB
MMVLVFHIGADRYGLRLRAIARVLPVADLKQLPLTPDWVAGVMDLHGQPMPVVDLSRLAGLPPYAACFDTRIVVVDYALADGSTRVLGLLAEHVIGIDTVDEAALGDSGVSGAAFLGPVASQGTGMLQLVEVDQLLPPDVRALLFQPEGAAP